MLVEYIAEHWHNWGMFLRSWQEFNDTLTKVYICLLLAGFFSTYVVAKICNKYIIPEAQEGLTKTAEACTHVGIGIFLLYMISGCTFVAFVFITAAVRYCIM